MSMCGSRASAVSSSSASKDFGEVCAHTRAKALRIGQWSHHSRDCVCRMQSPAVSIQDLACWGFRCYLVENQSRQSQLFGQVYLIYTIYLMFLNPEIGHL